MLRWLMDAMETPVALAAAAAAWINGKAGEAAERETNSVSMTAGDTVRHIPQVISSLTEKE